MAITTIDQALAGSQPPVFFTKSVSPTLVAGRHQSLWGLSGLPGLGSFDATLTGVALSSTSAQVAGQIPFSDPGSGNTYLARFQGAATQPGTLVLADRLWHNGGITITSTSLQPLSSAAWPSRDNAGTANGAGVLLGVEVSAATGAGTPTLTIGYTNQAGTASRTATNVVSTIASSAAGAFYPIGLQAGDSGVRSVESITLSATWTSGTINLVAYRPLAALELPSGLTPNAIDAITGGFPRLFNGTVPFLLFIPSTTTASVVMGSVVYTQG